MTKQEVRIVVREELAKLSDKQDTLAVLWKLLGKAIRKWFRV